MLLFEMSKSFEINLFCFSQKNFILKMFIDWNPSKICFPIEKSKPKSPKPKINNKKNIKSTKSNSLILPILPFLLALNKFKSIQLRLLPQHRQTPTNSLSLCFPCLFPHPLPRRTFFHLEERIISQLHLSFTRALSFALCHANFPRTPHLHPRGHFLCLS